MMHNTARIAVAATVISICVSAYVAVTPQMPSYFSVRAPQVQDAISRMSIDEIALARISTVKPKLAVLGRPASEQPTPIDIGLLGYREIKPLPPPPAPIPEPEPVVEAPPPPAPPPFDYKVSMTYVSSNHRFAVIDGRFYREGATLSGGERLLAIAPNAVQIERRDRSGWVELQREQQGIGEGNVIETDQPGMSSGAEIRSDIPLSVQVRHDS